jgi:CO dehydrogenase nickel-insertion accessory protein CooC1
MIVIGNKRRELTADTASEPKSIRVLMIGELDAVSGGCPCRFTTNCDCDKPSARHK